MGQVTLRGARKRFGEVEIIRGIDLEVRDGEFLVFVGPSGCGKSTTLRMIAGLESISEGELLIDGERANDRHPAERGCAMVFQSYALYPHMTVAENMGFALKMAGVPRREREAQVARAADILRLGELLQRYPKELSGGQRQRVAIGRAIVRKPKVFLFDEPLSNLDAALRVNTRIELGRLHRELGTTMIYVTHDQVEAMTLGDRIAVMRKGILQQCADPFTLYTTPANQFVAGFIGSPPINFFTATVAADGSSLEASGVRMPLGPVQQGLVGALRGKSVTVGIRPEDLHLEPQGGVSLPATVDVREPLGNETLVHWSSPVGTVVSRVPGQSAPAIGASADLHFAFAKVHFFDPESERSLVAAPAA